MRIVFRTDAARFIGSGHVMRCLTLAEGMLARGASVSFVCREHEGHLCELIGQRGFPVDRLPASGGGTAAGGLPHAAWLGATWEADSEETRRAIQSSDDQPDWLVVDHYAIGRQWESALRSSVGRIMAIDDLADRLHDCDLLLDQNLVARMNSRYADKVPALCKLMLGPDYALLQPSYSQLRSQTPERQGPVHRIFVFFGGADADNLTGRSLGAFLSLDRPDIELDVVVSPGSPHVGAVRKKVSGHGNIHVHESLPTLAPLIARADLAVGAGGVTTWERFCLGLPAIVITLAENQRPVAEYLHEQGLIQWIGHGKEVDQRTIADALRRVLEMKSLRDWSSRCFRICSGLGVFRVLELMNVPA